jgi:hypothetical protein
MDGIVKQLDQFNGVVIECSCVTECMKANQDLSQAQRSTYQGVYKVKQCQLTGNPEHGNRCLAYPNDSSTWLIDSDPTKIKGIPTQDGIIR